MATTRGRVILLERCAAGGEDPWETSDFHRRQLGSDTYLPTYVLRQEQPVTRRLMVWQRSGQGWQVAYHQGTPVN